MSDGRRSLADGVWAGTRRATRHLFLAGIEVARAAAAFVDEIRSGGDGDTDAGLEWIPLDDESGDTSDTAAAADDDDDGEVPAAS